MKRLNKYTIATERGNSADIMTHEEIFGVAFGAPGVIKQTFGTGAMQENAGSFCWELDTGNLTETMVGYRFVFSNMATVQLAGIWSMVASSLPFAKVGDAGNLLENKDCVSFISADGKDPLGVTKKQGYVPTPNGWAMGEIETPSRPDGGYPPGAKVYLTVNCKFNEGNIMPVTLAYVGSNDYEHGGEQPIIPELLEGTAAIPMTLGQGDTKLEGIFTYKT